MKLLKCFIVPAIAVCFMSFDLPTGWFKDGSAAASYDMGVDKHSGPGGTNAASIKSIDADIKGYGALVQACLPDKYLVSRVRMTGMMKTKDVTDWAGFWLRADQDGAEQALSFDNMFDRSIKGTTDWTRYEIVIDIPAKTTIMSYGALLSGTGQIWFDDLTFEIVDKSVPTTGKGNDYALPQRMPDNLSFEN